MKAKIFGAAAIAATALFASSGIAAAEPDVEAIATSQCNYSQVMNALNAQSPAAASELSGSVLASAWLQNLIAATPDGRREMINQVQGVPEIQQYASVINQVVYSCQNY